ncbi:MAG TPA: branched-chain amino acid ABC transporter permease [Candidatus Limnocylindria bacterium]|jgi:branched-chain amino acid transport system permease protein|nr:branched-chain amino acid ABC transporter permease [Candidatus Limnocylindria bacterium]
MHLIAQDLVNGILAGGILGLVALGFSLVWGIMNIINLAYGAFIMLGAYVTYQLFTSFHLDPFLSIPISFAALFVLGYLLGRYVINWVARAPVLTTFLLTFGLSLLLVNIALLVWTSDTVGVTTAYSGANFTLDGVTIPWTKLFTLIAALAITGVMQVWLTRSKMGRAIRATAMDIGAAQLSGVRVAQIYAIVFGLGAGLAGVAGTLLSLSYSINPSMGDPFLIKAFVVCVLGGLGSVEGALVGGLTYGIVESFATQLDVTIGSQHISGSGLQDAVALIVLLVVLIVRPRGIMGKATA